MYLHSYQSYIWNKVVSRRIQEFGLKPIVGDLIANDSELTPVNTEDVNTDDNTGRHEHVALSTDNSLIF